MRAKSARAARQHRERVAMLQRSHGPERCQWPRGCASEAVDAHEALSRARGGDPTNPDWLLCRRHHDDVTTATGAFLAWCIDQRLLASAAPRARVHGSAATGSVRAMPDQPEVRQVPLRLPADLVDAIDARRAKVGEASRNAWIERALRWALAQPVREQRVVERT